MNLLYFFDLYTQNLKWIAVAFVVIAGISVSFDSERWDHVAADFVICWLCYVLLLVIGSLIGTPLARAICDGLFLTIVLCKDVVNGRSLGKRIGSGVQVVNATSGKLVSPLLSIIRNVFELFWFIDFIPWVLGGRRICDYLLNTKVVEGDKMDYSCKTYYVFTRAMLFWILMCFLVCTGVIYLLRYKAEWLLSLV